MFWGPKNSVMPLGVGLTRSTIRSFPPLLEQKTVLMVVSLLWRGLGILGLTVQASFFSQVQLIRRFLYDDKKVANIAPVQSHYYCVRWVE